jgi:glycosyltransferase involved in cell wall biosynthesis
MRKVLFVITKSNWGGAQRYVFDIATALPKDAWIASVALGGTGLAGASGGALEEALKKSGVRTLFVPAFMREVSLFNEYRVLRQLWGIFAAERPDVVHLNSSKAGGLGALAARLAGVPRIVFTVHGSPWKEDRGAMSRALIRFFSWLTFLMCHRVIAISTESCGEIARMPLCSEKVRLVHNGIAPLQFLEKDDARSALLPDMPPGAFLIGAVGELVWNKGYHVLLRAVRTLKRRGKKFTLCIIGEGEERTFIETMTDDEDLNDSVRLLGFVPDAYRYMKAFDLFALPSVKEGLPYVALEAGQASLPLIASAVGGLPDLVGDRVSGLRVTPHSHDDFADRLEELMDDPALRQRLGMGLRERVESEFSLGRMLQGTLAAYLT